MRGLARLPFAVKFSLAISALAVGMTTISVSFMYTQLYGLLLRQTAGRLKDVGQTSTFLFEPDVQDRILRLTQATEARRLPLNRAFEITAAGDTAQTLSPAIAQELMASEDFLELVQILRRIGEASRAQMQFPQRNYAQPSKQETDDPAIISAYLMVEIPQSPDRQFIKFIADGLYRPQEDWPGNPIGNLFHIPEPIFAKAFEGESQMSSSFYSDKFGTWLTAIVPIKNAQGEVIATLGLDFDATQELVQVGHLRWICVGAVFVSFILSIAVAISLSRWLGPPIDELEAAAERVRHQDYSTLVKVKSPVELRILAITFNAMVREIRRYAHSLEDQNKTLELLVQDRTKELSHTLDVLKATQAELMLENALLRHLDSTPRYEYQVGGSLPLGAPTYVVRAADRYLYQALRQQQYCYVLNVRQIGKSSLQVQMMQRMQSEGYRCASIDLSVLGNGGTTLEQWYTGFIHLLSKRLRILHRDELRHWLRENEDLSPIQRLDQFVQEQLLPKTTENMVVFIDEIDSILGLRFASDDFFIWLRHCFNQRAEEPEYKRLSFVLLGVATPSQLIQDKQRTPFNIGQSIQLQGFQVHEAYPLLQGLSPRIERPQVMLQQILSWTEGQPFLTQKICQLICHSDATIGSGEEQAYVDQLVRSQLIDQWESNDNPEHFGTIRDRLLYSSHSSSVLLSIYQQLLEGETVLSDGSAVQAELILSGLVVEHTHRDNTASPRSLQIANCLYGEIFNHSWLEAMRNIITQRSKLKNVV